MTTLADFPSIPAAIINPRLVHEVPVGPSPCRNWPLTRMTAEGCIKQYGHALIYSNGTMDEVVKWKRKNCFWIRVDPLTGQKRYHFDPAQFDEFIESLRSTKERDPK